MDRALLLVQSKSMPYGPQLREGCRHSQDKRLLMARPYILSPHSMPLTQPAAWNCMQRTYVRKARQGRVGGMPAGCLRDALGGRRQSIKATKPALRRYSRIKVAIALNQCVLDASMMPSCGMQKRLEATGTHSFPKGGISTSRRTLDFRVAIYTACQPHHLIATSESCRPSRPHCQ